MARPRPVLGLDESGGDRNAGLAADEDEVWPRPVADGRAGRRVHFDLDQWTETERQQLECVLAEEGVPRAWEGTSVTVSESDEARVDQITDEIEADLLVGVAEVEVRRVDDNGGAGHVHYDLGQWTEAEQECLEGVLTREAIEHDWHDSSVTVSESDEARVDRITDDVEAGVVIEDDELEPDSADHEGGIGAVHYDLDEWTEAERDCLEGC